MKFQRHTASLCNACYKEIPAVVEVLPVEVLIRKKCPEHGEQVGLLERNAMFYSMLTSLGVNGIYPGYFVDITRKCQLRCNPCYFPLEKADPVNLFSVESILSECKVGARMGQIILTGGEPTLHPQLKTIITEIRKFCAVDLLSNGIKLADKEYFDEIMPLLGRVQRNEMVLALHLSIHRKESEEWRKVIEHLRAANQKIASALIVIDSQESLRGAMAIAEETQDVVQTFRIKAASRLWAEGKPPSSEVGEDKIFISQMWDWLEDLGYQVELDTHGMNNKSVFVNVNVLSAGATIPISLMLVSWHDVANVDLRDIECGPYYRARNGEVRNFVHASLINEGMDKARKEMPIPLPQMQPRRDYIAKEIARNQIVV